MEYRLVEIVGERPDSVDQIVELRRFDSAYHAVEEMQRALHRGDERVWRWHLLDEHDRVLFGPDDLVEVSGAAA